MVKAYFNIALILLSFQAQSQVKIDAERPRETKSPDLVKGNNLQIETGFRKEKLEEQQYLYQHPSVNIRYGLFNALELRMELASQTIRNKVSKESKTGFIPVYFGVKAKILPESNWIPSIGALAQLGIPSLASAEYFDDGLPFKFRTLFSNTLTRNLRLQYNAGVSWQEKENKLWSYTVSPTLRVSDHLDVFVEEYAFLKNGLTPEHYLNGGLYYFLNKNAVFDLSAGVGLSDRSSPYFLNAGFSLRLPFTGEERKE